MTDFEREFEDEIPRITEDQARNIIDDMVGDMLCNSTTFSILNPDGTSMTLMFSNMPSEAAEFVVASAFPESVIFPLSN